MSTESAGQTIVSQLPKDCRLDVVVIGAGQFHKESFDEPSWEGQLAMYKISAMGPVFVVHHLTKARLLHSGAKVVLVSSEAGSIGLRHPKEGGGMYGHHASKAALNMAGRLLALDLEKQGVIVSLVHPGFMRTEMTAGVGFDQFWDSGGGASLSVSFRDATEKLTRNHPAVHPDEAADSLVGFVKTLDMAKSGQLWAPRGPADIGTAEDTMEPKDQLSTPLRLPW